MATHLEAERAAINPTETQARLSAVVQESLMEILHSTPFRNSKQAQRLLQYIVDQSLAGHPELLKERIIGIEVFGRAPDYDTNNDPVVRTRAAEVRKRLAQFYVADGDRSFIRIEIPAGAYHATFVEKAEAKRIAPTDSSQENEDREKATTQAHSSPPPAQFSRLTRSVTPARRKMLLFALLPLIPILGLTVYTAYLVKPTTANVQFGNAIANFWDPILDSPGPILVYTGSNPVYMLSPSIINRYKRSHKGGELTALGYEPSIPTTSSHALAGRDFILKKDVYITIGDLSANVSVAKFLASHHRRFNLRLGGDVAFGDLRASPSILVGAFNNRWTLRLTNGLRYEFHNGNAIENHSVHKKQWTITYSPDGQVVTDYGLIARLVNSPTGKSLIVVAGIGESGTRAAAEFITHDRDLQKVVNKLPADWPRKNIELILRVTVVNNIPTHSSIVAIHYW